MTSEEEDLIVEALRTHGGTVTIGGSRCHTDYSHGPEGFVAMPFDEGSVQVYALSEADLRAVIRDTPAPFRELLKRAPLLELRAAWAAEDWAAARRHLAEAMAISDGLQQGPVLDAVLAHLAGAPVAAADLAIARATLAGQTAWHVYMSLVAGWQRTPATAAGGLRFTAALEALLGADEHTARLRAAFAAFA